MSLKSWVQQQLKNFSNWLLTAESCHIFDKNKMGRKCVAERLEASRQLYSRKKPAHFIAHKHNADRT